MHRNISVQSAGARIMKQQLQSRVKIHLEDGGRFIDSLKTISADVDWNMGHKLAGKQDVAWSWHRSHHATQDKTPHVRHTWVFVQE